MSREHEQIVMRVGCPRCETEFTLFMPLMGGKTEKQQCIKCKIFTENRKFIIIQTYASVQLKGN